MSERAANLLAATAQLVTDAVAEQLAAQLPHGASAPAALITIAHHPGLSIDRLSVPLGLTHSGTVRLIDRLEADELVRREKRAERAVKLHLTRRGRRAVERIEAARIVATDRVLAPLSTDERRQLDAILSRLLAARTHDQADLRRICRLCSFDACEGGGSRCPVAAAAATAG